MAEQKLIELAEAAASLTGAETSDCNNTCTSSSAITVNNGSLPVSLAEEANVLLTTFATASNNSSNFCPVGYMTKAHPQYVTRRYDAAFPCPEGSCSYPCYSAQPLGQAFTDPGLTHFFQPSDVIAHVLAEEDTGVKDVTELELEILDMTPTSLTTLKALDLLSDVSSRVVVSAAPVPESASSLYSTATAAGMDCISSNMSVVTLRVPDSSLAVSHGLGTTAQSECECSLHDVKMKLEIRGGNNNNSSSSGGGGMVELQAPAGYPASEVVTAFLSESFALQEVNSEVRSPHPWHYQQQMNFLGWPGTVSTRVEGSSHKYLSYLPQPAVHKQQRPVSFFTTPPTPAPPPTSAPAVSTTAVLRDVSVFIPPQDTPATSTSYPYNPPNLSVSQSLRRPERASYYKATPANFKAPSVKVVSQSKRKGKTIYNVFPPPPPVMYVGGARQAAPNTFSVQPVLKLYPEAEKGKEASFPAISPDNEVELAPQFDPLSIGVEEVSSQPAEKETLDQFQETASSQPNGPCTFCCGSCLGCLSSSCSEVCLPATCIQSDMKGLKRKMKIKEERQDSPKTRDTVVVAPRRSRRNSTLRCHYCPRLFANNSNVARHIRVFHPTSYRPRRNRLSQNGMAARTKPAAVAGRKKSKTSVVSVGIQCTLVPSSFVMGASTQTLQKRQPRNGEFAGEVWKADCGVQALRQQQAFSSDSGGMVVTSSFSANQGGREHAQSRSAGKVSAETDVSSSLMAGIVALMKEKPRNKTSKRRGRRPASAAAVAAAHNVTRRHVTSMRPNPSQPRLVTSSSDKLVTGSGPSSSWNSPSSTSHCNVNFRTKPRTRINSTIPCPYCPRFFSVMSNLKRHTRMQHSDVFVFNCNVCPHKFSMRRTLKKHMQIHAVDHPFQCLPCLMRFRFADHLHAHAKKHDIDKFPCSDCGLTFYTITHLHEHHRLHH